MGIWFLSSINTSVNFPGVILSMFNPYSAQTVFISQILTYKDDPRIERISIFLMAVNP